MKTLVTLIKRARADGCTGLASMLAYNFFLVLPVGMIFLVATLALLPVDDLSTRITAQLEGVVPTDALDLIRRIAESALSGDRSGIFLFSLLGTLYVMNNGYAGLIMSLNRIYDVREQRRWLRIRLRALVMSVVAGGSIISAFALALAAPALVDWLSGQRGAAESLALWLGRVRWPGIVLLVVVGMESTYRYAPCGGPRWRPVSPGTVFAASVWVVFTVFFGYYVDNYGSLDRLYGTLGTVIVLLTWIWSSALMFLIGAEINAMWRGERGGDV